MSSGVGYVIHIKFRHAAVSIVSCPLVAMVTCVVIASSYHGMQSTRTHCNVVNVLPSISAAIGDYTPERYIWRILIALHAVPRFIVAHMYYRRYLTKIYKPGRFVCAAQKAVLILHYLENIALLGMSYVSSRENFDFHELMFIIFVSSSIAYMIASLYLSRIVIDTSYSRPYVNDATALRYKKYAFIINISSFILALYFYWRHNAHCEPYVYSLFAMCEYLVVVSNMIFHFTAYWDFSDQSVYITDYDISKHS